MVRGVSRSWRNRIVGRDEVAATLGHRAGRPGRGCAVTLAPATETLGSTLPIGDIRVGTRFRKYLGDIDALAASIAEVGLLHPIVVTPTRELIAGERRIEAVKRLGWTNVPVTVVDLRDVVRGEAAENIVRADFQMSERHAILEALRPIEEQAARERMTLGKVATGSSPARTRDRLGAYVGLSGRTVEKLDVVMKAAEADPELAPIVAKMDATGKVDTAYRAITRRRIVARIEAEPEPMPAGPFRVIVADPPWQYDVRAEDATHRGRTPYPTMSTEEIAALPVGALAHDDAVLWLWTTNAHLESAFGIVREWGFAPKTVLTWAKDRMGTGDWLRGQTEHCLMGVRGRAVVNLTNQTTLLRGPLREHSRKPDEFYVMVERLCPGSKVELFARESRPGWQRWGAEAPMEATA